MKKNFLVYVLLLLMSSNDVFAENIKQEVPGKQQLDLKEIILDTEPNSYTLDNTVVASDAPVIENNTLIPSPSCECSSIQPKRKERKIFSRLNPMGGVIKVNKTIECGCGCVNGVVDKQLEKLDGTPLSGVKTLDKIINTGFGHFEGGIDKSLGVLDKTIDTGLGSIDKVINSGIDKDAVQQWLDGDHAARKCFGARPLLESHGVTIDSSFLYSPFMKTAGGANGEIGTKGYSLFSLGVTLDTEAAKMWKGGKFFGLYQRKVGMGMSGTDGAMGDYFGFDGWNMPQVNQIGEYWYQQKLFDGKIRMKVGKQDSNTDFGYLNSGWDFMNTAFSVNPNTPLPSFPTTPFGFMFEINPKEWLSIRNGIYSKDSCPYNITEVEFKSMIKKMPGRYMLGAWEMSDSNGYGVATGVDGGETVYNNFNRNYGCYFNFEQMVYKEQKENPDDMQGLVLFGQLGMSPSNKNDLSKYGAVGLHYKGPIPKRDNDLAGIAVGCGNFASRLNNIAYDLGGRTGSETVLEAFYRVFITKWLYLQPDVQFIMNPSGIYNNSVAIGLRSVITF